MKIFTFLTAILATAFSPSANLDGIRQGSLAKLKVFQGMVNTLTTPFHSSVILSPELAVQPSK